jgi:1-acyl-sn-glycerol-3-phosphate acyltransferase
MGDADAGTAGDDGRRETHESPDADVAWARSWPGRALRELILMGVLGPAMDLYTRRCVHGHEHLGGCDGPVLFVANHSSHMDTPAILRALPARWRLRTAVAAATDYFYRKRRNAYAVSLAFNTVPMERNGGGLEPGATSHVDRLIDEGWSLLVFPEGTRSRDGSVGRLRSGAAVLAAEHDLPIVPIFVTGTLKVMPPGRRWMRRDLRRRHPIAIRFGAPIRHAVDEDRTDVMERLRLFYEAAGAPTTPAEDSQRPVSA